MPSQALSPLKTVLAVARGYLPRVVQARGWVLAALAILPVLFSLLGSLLAQNVEGFNSRTALQVFHGVLVSLILPIMALVAAPGGIREDLEQRTLPLILTRPVTVWALPLGKGLLWFLWGGLWLGLGCSGLLFLGADAATLAAHGLALILAFWAELAFMNLLGLVFSRGTLWGALVLFGWENLLRVLPASLQRFTFLHHIESISGSRGGMVANYEVLAQAQITSPVWVSALALVLFGALCWGLAGWKLHLTPIGLAGQEGEG